MNPLTASPLRRTARQFDRRSRLDHLVTATIHGLLALFFGAAAWFGEVVLCRIGCSVIALAFLYSSFRFVRECAEDWFPSERAAECLDFYRTRLTRRRDLLRGYLNWGRLPTIGVALSSIGWILAEPRNWPSASGAVAFWVGFQFAVMQKIRLEADHLQKELDLLGK
jgi:hypothetical protein